jgi:hypothetical protein
MILSARGGVRYQFDGPIFVYQQNSPDGAKRKLPIAGQAS